MGAESWWERHRASLPAPAPARVYRETPWSALREVPQSAATAGRVGAVVRHGRACLHRARVVLSDSATGLHERLLAWRQGGPTRRARSEWWDYYEHRAESGHDLPRFSRLLVRNGPPDLVNPYASSDLSALVPEDGCLALDIADILVSRSPYEAAPFQDAQAGEAWLRTLEMGRPIPETRTRVHADNLLMAAFAAASSAHASRSRLFRIFRGAARMGLMPSSDIEASIRMADLSARLACAG